MDELIKLRATCVLKCLALTVLSVLSLSPAAAGDETEQLLLEKFRAGNYSSSGADTCLRCHDDAATAASFLQSVHGDTASPHGPMAKLQCETCHGPRGKHRGRNEPMIQFGASANVSPELQNSVCLSCHMQDADESWHLGTHDIEDLACADCHQVHAANDPIRDPVGQVTKCTSCHLEQRAAMNKRSHHPLAGAQAGSVMTCVSCHNPHGSLSEADLNSVSLNDNCVGCHAEFRGPVLWEHEPVVEDCSTCHEPHGSVNDALLAQRAPQLCQGCHASDGHVSRVLDNSSDAFVAGQSCLNCHSQVHGSNHPSGALLSQ
ncbi:MAG: cystathionine beta-synthase [Halioglobus sp.]|nr:cystathionine beta-synthase [Halioglobus sp.]